MSTFRFYNELLVVDLRRELSEREQDIDDLRGRQYTSEADWRRAFRLRDAVEERLVDAMSGR